jgi:MSHA pilin protein MshA
MMRLSKVMTNGFTLVEILIVIAIIGILSAVAMPKFINIANNAQISATTSVSGALSSANASNYVARKLNSSLGVAIANCTDVANAMLGGVPSNYTITNGPVGTDSSIACTLSGPNSTIGIFTATGIS